MNVLGITGPLGSGKSTLAKRLQKKGCVWIHVDREAQVFYRPDSPLYPRIKSLFGTTQRARIREQVFNDSKKLSALNQLIHPALKKRIADQLKIYKQKKIDCVIIDAAVLYEIGLDRYCDHVVALWAKPAVLIERAVSKGWTPALAKKVIRAQKSKRFLMEHADAVLDSSPPSRREGKIKETE